MNIPENSHTVNHFPPFHHAYDLLSRIFLPTDPITIRPIEIWTENSRKLSRVLFKHSGCFPLSNFDQSCMNDLLQLSESEQANIFFGVCPRFAPEEGFDSAWQIRTVRTLWADIDDCTLEDAVQRCITAGLPEPSVIVVSGTGIHLYWVLDTMFAIDDVGDPPKVEIEGWVKTNAKKVPVRYYCDLNGKKTYLTDPTNGKPISKNKPELSPKALWIQDIVKGIAVKLGGDHTHDLARLLRIPGTLNRKNNRNGQEPQSCFVSGGSGKHYSLANFQCFVTESPDAKLRAEIRTFPLPTVLKNVSPTKQNRLNDLIVACTIAENGQRSEHDFEVCCYAIENGINKDYLCPKLKTIGKFAECGEPYFQLTWKKAEKHFRQQTYNRVKQEKANIKVVPSTDEQIIIYDPKATRVEDLMRQITDCLLRIGNCFLHGDQIVVIRNGNIHPLSNSHELPGILNTLTEFAIVDARGNRRFEPLPDKYANTWINNHKEIARLPKIQLFTRNPVFKNDIELAQPGFDPQTGIFYAGEYIKPAQGTQYLDYLLQDFCFRCNADRTNYIGIMLTLVLMPLFSGAKPGVLFVGNQPELGKTILAQIIAILRDGFQCGTCSYTSDEAEFEKRIASRVRAGATTIIIDNAKGKNGKAPRIESACLERCLTDSKLSFRLLGTSSEIQCENSHVFCITANTPEVGHDLITRCVPINLRHEGNPSRRSYRMDDPEKYAQINRKEILSELIGTVG